MPTVLVFSEDAAVRDQIRMSIGRSPGPGVDNVRFLLAETQEQVVKATDERRADLLVLDGEAWPAGGLGLCRQLKDEVRDCPPCVVLTGRHDDRLLASWSQADAVLTHPLDAFDAAAAVSGLLRDRVGLLPSGADRPAR